jgi:hypothetical protein
MAVDPFDGVRQPEKKTPIVDRAAENALGRDAFLRIFLAQLEAQDPLSPQDSSQLSAQLAQFSQLEQSVLGTEQLRGIAGKLDKLIEASGGAGPALDPVSLIGRSIEFEADELAPSASGDAQPLSLPLPSGEHGALLIEVEEVGSGRRGLLALAGGRDAAGRLQDLPAGDYQLRLERGAPRLSGPAGIGELGASTPPFQRLQISPSGEASLAEPPETFSFAAGQRYRLSARAVPTAGGEPLKLDLGRVANVTAVRIRDGRAFAVAGGIEVDPARIRSVRE